MTDNKQQSVVSWLLKELIKDGYIKRIPVLQFQKAKAMHKQEIENAYNSGQQIPPFEYAEQYYKKTFPDKKKN
jgi:hypothetical protein